MTASSVDPATGNLLVGGSRCSRSGCPIHPRSEHRAERRRRVGRGRERGRQLRPQLHRLDGRRGRRADHLGRAGTRRRTAARAAALARARRRRQRSSQQPLLDKVVDAFKAHPASARGKAPTSRRTAAFPAGIVAVYEHLQTLDPHHPVVIIEAPRGAGRRHAHRSRKPPCAPTPRPATSTGSTSTRSRPPGAHAGGPPVNTDISVVGDMTTIVARGNPTKAIWTTLQIAWSGVFPPHPVVFPTLQQARFMAYDAIIAGARGTVLLRRPVHTGDERGRPARGWNWTYWQNVQRPLLARAQRCRPRHRALIAPLAAAHDHRRRAPTSRSAPARRAASSTCSRSERARP